MSRVTVTDHGANALLARARELARGARVRVGVLADAPKKERSGAKGAKLSLVEIASLHEFGAPSAGIPQRSFIRATVDEKASAIGTLQEKLLEQLLAGKLSPAQALDLLGAKVAGMVQTRIAQGIAPALQPETIRRKKSSKPLIDTGQLRSSVTWKVEG